MSRLKTFFKISHPQGREVDPDIVLPQTSVPPQPVIYEEITSELVEKIAKKMKGSGGPSLIDSDSWKHFLCSRIYKRASADLRQATADLAKVLCTETSSVHKS